MARINGPLLSASASGTLAHKITFTKHSPPYIDAYHAARASPALKFRAPRAAPPPTPAQSAERAAVAAATAYAKAPPPIDWPAIYALAQARDLPFFQAAQAYHFAHPTPPAGTTWDDGATEWDDGLTTWDP